MKTVFWFRRDLRLDDNHGLFQGLKNSNDVIPIFIFDTTILSKLSDKKDQRVHFIHQCLENLQKEFVKIGSSFTVLIGNPSEILPDFLITNKVQQLFLNHDYEPSSIERDQQIHDFCKTQNIGFKSFKDQVIFEKSEVTKADKKPYTIFTPYSKKWKEHLRLSPIEHYSSEDLLQNFEKTIPKKIPSLAEIGFEKSNKSIPSTKIQLDIIATYDQTRDYPSINGTSRLSVHLRFGTISPRKLVKIAQKTNEIWLNELIWREFYMTILFHFPHVVEKSFKKEYDLIPWVNNETEFQKWCEGKTGYPIVDAGMRELNETGFMHNRVRMITASFLVKHLLIDWRWGEHYFAEKLLDYDLSANNGGWQWAASSGCDAVPYFRIFNPSLQTEKFDKSLTYIRKWIPEFDNPFEYPTEIINHKFARQRAITTYKNTLKS